MKLNHWVYFGGKNCIRRTIFCILNTCYIIYGVQSYLSCHVIVRTAYPFPWGCGVLLLEPIPALSQGEGRDKLPAHRRALTDEQCGVQCLAQGHFDMPGAGIWTSDLPITSRPALPTELQPPLTIVLFKVISNYSCQLNIVRVKKYNIFLWNVWKYKEWKDKVA